ncbi:MAG: gamma-glutamyl-gamma-aminobutyrate hydrolase family protein [Xanthomonadales bacterium]|nr:gamma-glutamyl-gamma-aminobutyrate hydrolase family protein [Xanthomonadales bacterium]
MLIRIGLTMRGHWLPEGQEYRDSLDRRWANFMQDIIPECQWLPLPSLGESTLQYASDMGVNGLVFTGGDDVGTDKLRDVSEQTLLGEAAKQAWPVLGVCRGMQVLNLLAGGALCELENHAGSCHEVHTDDEIFTVNSYHTNGINRAGLAADYSALATSDSGVFIEAFRGLNVLGLMWHPEREESPSAITKKWIRELFLGEKA